MINNKKWNIKRNIKRKLLSDVIERCIKENKYDEKKQLKIKIMQKCNR